MALPHQQFAASRLMVMAAPNGARRTRRDHPALPITPAELAECASRLVEARVGVLHLHVRDEQGRHTLDPEYYRAAIAAIEAVTGDRLIAQVTSEAVGRYSAAEQMDMVRQLRPEAVSLALRELCPDMGAEKVAAPFFAWLVRERIWPQYILYDADDVCRFDNLRRRGVFGNERPHCLLVVGSYAGEQQGEIEELDAMRAAADCNEFPWSACCFGQRESSVMREAVSHGGHVRLGFENNLLLGDGGLARDNAALIESFLASIDAQPRRPATADEIREVLLTDYQ